MNRDEQLLELPRPMRNQPTDAESRLWDVLRAHQLKVKFRRQTAIGPYLADFACFSHQLIVDLDGPQHVEAQGKLHDECRTAWLAARGFRVIRFRNQSLAGDVWSVVEGIQRVLREPCETLRTPLPSPPRGGGGSRTGGARKAREQNESNCTSAFEAVKDQQSHSVRN